MPQSYRFPASFNSMRGHLTTAPIHLDSLHPQLSAFHDLRYLELGSLLLDRVPDPAMTPPLAKLEAIDTDDKNISFMDDWLLACPSLTTIFIVCYRSAGPVPKVITSGKIRHIGIKSCAHWSHTPKGWLPVCTSLRILEVPLTFLDYHIDYMPLILDELRLVTPQNACIRPSLLEEYMSRMPSIGDLVFVFLDSNRLFFEHKYAYERICKAHGVQVSFDTLLTYPSESLSEKERKWLLKEFESPGEKWKLAHWLNIR